MKIECPNCKQVYEADESYCGKEIECACGSKIVCPPAPQIKETKSCPYCGEEILAVAQKCKHCGEFLGEARAQTQTQNQSQNDAVVYILLVLFLGMLGAHNFYKGQTGYGLIKIAFLLLGAVFFVFGGAILWLISGIWCIYELIVYLSPKSSEPKQELKLTWVNYIPIAVTGLILAAALILYLLSTSGIL